MFVFVWLPVWSWGLARGRFFRMLLLDLGLKVGEELRVVRTGVGTA